MSGVLPARFHRSKALRAAGASRVTNPDMSNIDSSDMTDSTTHSHRTRSIKPSVVRDGDGPDTWSVCMRRSSFALQSRHPSEEV